MAKTGAQAVAWAKSHTSWHPEGTCLIFVRTAFGVNSYYGSARLAWYGANKKHYVSRGSQVPAGVPVFWLGGSHGYGHIAVSLGNGYCRSTDWPHRYQVSTARIDDISRTWGQHLVGWTEDLNRVTIQTPVKSGPNVIDLSSVVYAVHNHGAIKNGATLKKAVLAEVGRGSMNVSSNTLGEGFHNQYKLVQRKYFKAVGQTPSPGDVDGIPGISSLTWLCRRHGLTARP